MIELTGPIRYTLFLSFVFTTLQNCSAAGLCYSLLLLLVSTRFCNLWAFLQSTWCKPEFEQIIIQPRIRISRFKISKVVNAKQLSNLLGNGRPICVSLYVGHGFGNVDTQPHTDVDVHMAPNNLDGIYGHAIFIVDSGKIKNRSFWLAVNSFGHDWGDGGLIKIDEVAILYDVTLLPKEAPQLNI